MKHALVTLATDVGANTGATCDGAPSMMPILATHNKLCTLNQNMIDTKCHNYKVQPENVCVVNQC